MELVVFARFHAREGREDAVAAAVGESAEKTRAEAGCLEISAHRAVRDPRLFWIYSRWRDEAAFEIHADLPRVASFLEHVRELIDHPLDVTRTRTIA